MIGARQGGPGPFHRLIARATSRHLQTFVVPGMDVARATGLDLAEAGLTPVNSPRRANVLVLLSPLPHPLIESAVVAYAQIPRPRAIFIVGDEQITGLPEPDVRVSTSEPDLAAGVERLREIIEASSWQPEPMPFQHDSLAPAEDQDSESMGHHHHHHGGGGGDEDDHEAHSEHNHSDHTNHADHGGHEGHGEHDHAEHADHSNHDQASGHDHSGHGEGFMSMIAMTKDLPRSPDELQMDWLEVPFGPIHPGLPSGLNLSLTLDGDRIAAAEVKPGVTRDHLERTTPVPVDRFLSRMATLDRLAPGVYEVLAGLALEATHEKGKGARQYIIVLERARVLSHLNWLVSFAGLLGYEWLASQARALLGAPVEKLNADELNSIDRACRSYLMRRRLQGIGRLDPTAGKQARGPVARAMGLEVDARCDEPAYRALGFEPVTRDGGDAYARLLLRLDEIHQSLDLLRAAGNDKPDYGSPRQSDAHHAGIETPRGQASMALTVEDGQVTGGHLDTPSTGHVSLIPAVSEGLELSAGLVAIASLDLSPWETES